MRFFVWVDFQYEMLALFFGALLLILVYMAWAGYPRNRAQRTNEEIESGRGHEDESGHGYENLPVAPFLIFIYLGIAIWAVSYFIYMWARGIKF